MGYRTLRQCVTDLERNGQLIRIGEPIDARLELAEIHRRVCRAGGPALLFERVVGSPFPVVSNLFGTLARAEWIFRDTLDRVRQAIDLRMDPGQLVRRPARYWRAPLTAWSMRPRMVRGGPVLAAQTSIDQVPQQVSWPMDGGAFITLPQVYSEDVSQPGLRHSNLGMYRIQLSGGAYQLNRQVGMHYQIHRSIGVHHARARHAGRPFRVNVFVGGAPAMMLAAVMPLPEGMSELGLAGALAGHRIPMIRRGDELPIYAEADFCITGVVDPQLLLPEGPFGDHLGYYSLAHEFPVLNVNRVYHRADAIWPMTVVGRPPQEDSVFGKLIHQLTAPLIPTLVAGVHAVHAVDAAGVHPLLLAIGSERYAPYLATDRPAELLTQANGLLGAGQMSLAKYLWIIDRRCCERLDVHDLVAFLQAVLERVDWSRDIHFQTATTVDTLDYSGSGFNQGSKAIVAAVGAPRRRLPTEVPPDFWLPDGFGSAKVSLPGVLVVAGPKFTSDQSGRAAMSALCDAVDVDHPINAFPLAVVVDDSDFASRNVDNFVWVTFTRSNPATDVHGIGAAVVDKHWGCRGSLIIDARLKPHHAPPLEVDPETARRVDALAERGGPLARWL